MSEVHHHEHRHDHKIDVAALLRAGEQVGRLKANILRLRLTVKQLRAELEARPATKQPT